MCKWGEYNMLFHTICHKLEQDGYSWWHYPLPSPASINILLLWKNRSLKRNWDIELHMDKTLVYSWSSHVNNSTNIGKGRCLPNHCSICFDLSTNSFWQDTSHHWRFEPFVWSCKGGLDKLVQHWVETVIQSGRVESNSEYTNSYRRRTRRISHGASSQMAQAYQSPSLPPRSS